MDNAGNLPTNPFFEASKRRQLDEQLYYLLGSGEDPQANIEAQELRQLLQKGYNDLTQEELQVIELRYQHKKSPGQTAAQLGIPRKKLQSLERSGLKKIGKHLQAWHKES